VYKSYVHEHIHVAHQLERKMKAGHELPIHVQYAVHLALPCCLSLSCPPPTPSESVPRDQPSDINGRTSNKCPPPCSGRDAEQEQAAEGAVGGVLRHSGGPPHHHGALRHVPRQAAQGTPTGTYSTYACMYTDL